MKTLPFVGLTDAQKILARRRVDDVLAKIARESGRICVETASEVAGRARFSVNKYGHIWGIELPKDARFLR